MLIVPFNRGAFKDGCIGLEPQFHRDGYKASKMEGDYKASIKKVIYVEFDIGMKKLGTWISNQISRLRTRLNQISRLLTRSKLGRRSIPGSTPSMRETLEKKEETKKEKIMREPLDKQTNKINEKMSPVPTKHTKTRRIGSHE